MIRKFSIEEKLAVLDELIQEFRENRSLWSAQKQLEQIKAEKEKQR